MNILYLQVFYSMAANNDGLHYFVTPFYMHTHVHVHIPPQGTENKRQRLQNDIERQPIVMLCIGLHYFVAPFSCLRALKTKGNAPNNIVEK